MAADSRLSASTDMGALLGMRQRPMNIAAEQAILGGLLINGKFLSHVDEKLQPHHFADPMHGRIYAEARRRIHAGIASDAVSLKTWFESDPAAADAGGNGYLAQLLVCFISGPTMSDYADEMISAWQRRRTVEVAEELFNISYDGKFSASSDIPRIVEQLEATISSSALHKAVTLDDAMDSAIAAADAAQRGTGPRPLSTGFRDIDHLIGGLDEGTLNILAGRPGMGKSSLGHQIAVDVARREIGVLEISLEMTARELGRRTLSCASGVPGNVIKRGRFTPEQADAIFKARNELRNLPMWIEDGAGLSMPMISAKVREAKRKHSLGLVMVDHLHIVRVEDSDIRQGPTWAVGRISGAMKRLAKEHNIPVLLLAQLSRGVEGREEKRPVLSDLRQAGDIEQDADTVSFVFRPEYYLQKADSAQSDTEGPERHRKRVESYEERKAELAGKAELIFAKVRDGATGTVDLRFDGATTSFLDAG